MQRKPLLYRANYRNDRKYTLAGYSIFYIGKYVIRLSHIFAQVASYFLREADKHLKIPSKYQRYT